MHALVSGVFILLCTALLAAQPLPTQFTDQAAALGITARNVSGSTQEYIVETAVGGTAFFDYDSDGDVDLYVANGSRFEGFPTGSGADQLTSIATTGGVLATSLPPLGWATRVGPWGVLLRTTTTMAIWTCM